MYVSLESSIVLGYNITKLTCLLTYRFFPGCSCCHGPVQRTRGVGRRSWGRRPDVGWVVYGSCEWDPCPAGLRSSRSPAPAAECILEVSSSPEHRTTARAWCDRKCLQCAKKTLTDGQLNPPHWNQKKKCKKKTKNKSQYSSTEVVAVKSPWVETIKRKRLRQLAPVCWGGAEQEAVCCQTLHLAGWWKPATLARCCWTEAPESRTRNRSRRCSSTCSLSAQQRRISNLNKPDAHCKGSEVTALQ